MKISSEIMKKAHNMTKEIKAECPEVDYKFQLGICISYLCKEGENKMITYTTSNGAKIEIEITGEKEVEFLKVNDIVVCDKVEKYGVIVNAEEIIVKGIFAKKLGCNRAIIKANEEVKQLCDEYTNKELKKLENTDNRKWEMIVEARKIDNDFKDYMTNKDRF